MTADRDLHDARQARLAAVVMAVAMLGWMTLSWMGGRLGWPVHFAYLGDLAAIAAFIWALAVVGRIWWRRKTRD